MQYISSAQNSKIKLLRKLLSSRKARRERGLFVVEGIKALESMLQEQSCCPLRQVFYGETLDAPALLERCRDAELYELPDHLLERVGDVCSSQGILSVFAIPEMLSCSDLAAGAWLLCDGIADPGNLGTLIRSAVGAGFQGVLLFGDTVDPYNPKTVRASMGTLGLIAVHRVDDADVQRFMASGADLLAAKMDGQETLFDAAFPVTTIVAVGSEGQGLSETICSLANRSLAIPLAEGCESLNAAVAGSMMMFWVSHVKK